VTHALVGSLLPQLPQRVPRVLLCRVESERPLVRAVGRGFEYYPGPNVRGWDSVWSAVSRQPEIPLTENSARTRPSGNTGRVDAASVCAPGHEELACCSERVRTPLSSTLSCGDSTAPTTRNECPKTQLSVCVPGQTDDTSSGPTGIADKQGLWAFLSRSPRERPADSLVTPVRHNDCSPEGSFPTVEPRAAAQHLLCCSSPRSRCRSEFYSPPRPRSG
jgi:hypothetical protein